MKFMIVLLLSVLATTYAQQPSATVTVFTNGYAGITETATVTAFVPCNITLIGAPEALTVTYSNGSPALYSVSGSNLTVIPDINGTVSVNYYTYSIVGKNNVSWFVKLDTPYETRLILPPNASLVFMSSIPSTVGQVDSSIYLTLGPGNWTVSYIFSPPSRVTVSSSPTYNLWEISAAAVAAVAIVAGYLVYRRRKPKMNEGQMRELDDQIVQFLKSRGGSAKESEIRQKLVLPKTTAWRAIKRLEREGRVKVMKTDRENIVTLE